MSRLIDADDLIEYIKIFLTREEAEKKLEEMKK